MKQILKKIPTELKGQQVERKEYCRICYARTGKQVGKVDYWDIKTSNIVQCENCGLAQLDPMLTEEETAKGCLAYYIEESLRVSQKEQGKNLVRNFRRGVLFGHSLKSRNIVPHEILELGPGSGYFSEGLKFVFPDAKITIMDINEEVLNLNARNHNFATIKAVPETYISELENKFDLVVARDIIEHVIDIGEVVENISKYCKKGGYFHFITPNGHEDVWKHYLTYNHKKKPSQLLINHVNYFYGKGLLEFLKQQKFSPLEYYTYHLKKTRRGRGWKVSEKMMAPVSDKKDSDHYINNEIRKVREIQFNKKDVLDKWYIGKNKKILTYLVSWFQHKKFIRIAPELNVGHEINGLFKKL
ncbi:MAG: class I SAM-dependent methyltransferase [Candidatus Cyclobacteriaceae bacterium M2_1C_046]